MRNCKMSPVYHLQNVSSKWQNDQLDLVMSWVINPQFTCQWCLSVYMRHSSKEIKRNENKTQVCVINTLHDQQHRTLIFWFILVHPRVNINGNKQPENPVSHVIRSPSLRCRDHLFFRTWILCISHMGYSIWKKKMCEPFARHCRFHKK